MGATTGIVAVGTYVGNPLVDLATLLALIPNPDIEHDPGRAAGSNLDEMAPSTAAQLRVELLAMGAGGAGAAVASGSKTVSAGEATANQADIVTGLANITLANGSVSIFRAGTNVTADAVITEPTPGTIRVADGGATYNVTAGDIINWTARA
jgi:hypothetical protein